MENRFVKEIQRQGYKEIHVQHVPLPGETPGIFSEKIAEIINSHSARVIRATFFGNLNCRGETIKLLGQKLGGTDFPFSWIEGDNCSGSFINGVYIFAVSGIEVKRLLNGESVVGSFYFTDSAEFCHLGGLYSDPELIPSQQTENILDSAEKILKQVDMSFGDTIRTWYYLDDITVWYADFNKARDSFFQRHEIFKKRIPSSTGIGGRNVTGGKLCLELIAVRQKGEKMTIQTVLSPLQCSATNYGSSFSRALQYTDGEFSNLTISGTASIGPGGETMHINDMVKQVEMTFTVVKAILDSNGFSFGDIIRAYAYCRDKKQSNVFFEYCKEHIPEGIVFICTENQICRENLLFEIDIEVNRPATIT
jgi:enamine deaminase RidA (YjgF/YER057c/UK114 family)